MPKIYDNILTRAQVALEDGLPKNSTVDVLDFAPDNLKYIVLTVSFEASPQVFFEYADYLPSHLLFDHARLIEVVNYSIEGATIEFADNNDPTKIKYNNQKYTFPGMSEIIERMQSVQNDGAIFDAYYKAFAKYVAFKTIHVEKALPYLMGARNLVSPKSGREDARFYRIVEKRDEYFRALFCDAPIFAEFAVGMNRK